MVLFNHFGVIRLNIMKKYTGMLLISALVLSQLIGSTAHAITAADITMLRSMGIISAEQATTVLSTLGANSTASTPTTSTTQTSGTVNTSLLTQGGACITLKNNLLLGAQGAEVTLVQQFLRKQGHFTYPENSGYYGTQTKDAVIAFQIAQNLISSRTQLGAGSVGPATIARIKELTCAGPVAGGVSQGLAKIDSTSTYDNQERGLRKYRYTLSINPADDITAWRVRLVCDEDQITTNLRDLPTCNETMELKTTSSGKQTFSIQYRNASRANQMVGIIAEALDKDKKVIDYVEKIDFVAGAGIRDLAPRPGEGYTTITFTGSTSTKPITKPITRTAVPKCSTVQYEKVRALWTQTYPGELWNSSKTKIEVLGLAETNISRNAKSLMDKVEIVEPNGRSIMEIVEAYRNTHYFPDMAYVKHLNELGVTYSQKKTWLPFWGPETKLETIRTGIRTLIPSMPSQIIERERIASNDDIMILGELYEYPNNSYTTFNIPVVKWTWQGDYGRIGGQYEQRYLINNGKIIPGSTFTCGPISNSSFDILLIRK
jgi:peptidoglycan hydrolase-like protein with peptidoglycan-binding domain